MFPFDPFPAEMFIGEVKRKRWEEMGCSSKFHKQNSQNSSIPTNILSVFYIKATWKRLFPRRFNMEYACCVCSNHFEMPEKRLPLKALPKDLPNL